MWIDLFLPRLLKPADNTRLALLARLLARGTRRLPGLRQVHRHTDALFGAGYSVQPEAFGPFQVLHLHYDAVDGAFLPGGPDLLAPGFELLSEALTDPPLQEGAFPARWVDQEREALRGRIEALYGDRTLLAQRRCLEIMCAGEPYGLAAHGDTGDLRGLDGGDLLGFLHRLVETAPLDLYVCGNVEAERVVGLCREHLGWTRRGTGPLPVPPAHTGRPGSGPIRSAAEFDDVAQGRLVLGYRTGIAIGGPRSSAYPALVLLNLLLGGDAHSRLYESVREEGGLCYHVGTYTEPMGAMLFVEAGVDDGDRKAVCELVAGQLHELAFRGPEAGELGRSRALAWQRLDGFDDSRDDLVHFDYYRRLAGADTSRRRLRRSLGEVDDAAIRAAAAGIQLDTEYFLAPAGRGTAGAADGAPVS